MSCHLFSDKSLFSRCNASSVLPKCDKETALLKSFSNGIGDELRGFCL